MRARLPAIERLAEIAQVDQQPGSHALHAFAEVYGEKRTAMAVAYVSSADTRKAIAAYFGVHSSPDSRAVRRAAGQQPP